MKLNGYSYKILCLFLMVSFHQMLCAATVFQDPQQSVEFEDDFKDAYSSDKYDYEGKKIVGETPNRTGDYADYKNGKDKPRKKKERNDDDLTLNLGPFGFVFYIILFAAIVYLAYVLLNEGSTGLFSRGKHRKLNDTEDITAENIEKTDIDYLIEQAENEGDYRLATRYHYLLVLKTLSLKNHIEVEDDKTNTDYLNEIHNTSFRKQFEYILYLYNYIWYGEFPLNVEKYDTAKLHFVELIKQVK